MKKIIAFFLFVPFAIHTVNAQSLVQKLDAAFRAFESQESLANGIASLIVLNAETGQVVFAKNEKIGLAPASTLKTITSTAAYHILGANYTFETTLFYSGEIDANGILKGDIVVQGHGDPSLGSDRFPQTTDTVLLSTWVKAIQAAGIRKIDGRVIADDRLYDGQTAPRGWTWQDMGNYYGAGVSSLNWRENAFGINFQTGLRTGDPTQVISTTSDVSYLQLVNETTTGQRGTGDRVYAFSSPYSSRIYLRGTYGIDLKKTVYLSVPDGAYDAAFQLHQALDRATVQQTYPPITAHVMALSGNEAPAHGTLLHRHQSPALSELVYWFNQKSINLYGETLLKAMAYQRKEKTDTRDASEMLRDFWAEKAGIPKGELRIMDGSGLSPENRVTTNALARILLSVKKEPWFASFFESLPTYNGMRMKSGTIGGVLGYAGYHTNKEGKSFVFALLVNNYQGAAGPMRQRMFRILDNLK